MFSMRLAFAGPARLPLRSLHTSLRALNSEVASSAASDLGFQVNASRTRDLPTIDAEPSASSASTSKPKRSRERSKRGNEKRAPSSYIARRRTMAEELRGQGLAEDMINAKMAEAGLPSWLDLPLEQKEIELRAAAAALSTAPQAPAPQLSRPPRDANTASSTSESGPSTGNATDVNADASSSEEQSGQGDSGSVEPSRRAKSSMDAVDLSFLAPAQPEAAIAENRRAVKAKENARKPKTPREKRPQRAREVQHAPAADHSMAGLFGARSLISPAVRGARDPDRSYWAAGLEPAAARKADILRLAGSYTTLLPTSPLAAKPESAAEQARHSAAWTLALNPDVSMRGARAADGILGQYLK